MARDRALDAQQLVRVMEPRSGWQLIDFQELWEYRDLLYFLISRDIKVRYVQSVLGIGWAVVQPVFFTIVFTIVFGKLAKIGSDGARYELFAMAALVPWTYFAGAFSEATTSLLSNQAIVTKVYLPRLIVPLSKVLAKLLDFVIAFLILIALMVWFGVLPTLGVAVLPALILLMVVAAVGPGIWLSALAVQYRDIRFGVAFAVQLLMYAGPVAYPASLVPDRYRLVYSLNPMVGVIEGFRSALLDTNPMPWDLIGVGAIVASVLLLFGVFYFRRMEQNFADVV